MMMMMEKKGGSNIDQTSATELVVLGIPSNSKSIRVRSSGTILRAAASALCFAAVFTMIKNSQTNDFGFISYDDLGALKYLVYANAICSAYSVISGFVAAVPRPNTAPSLPWILFCSDQVLAYMILVAGAASAEVLYLANNGDVQLTLSGPYIWISGLLCWPLSHLLLSPFQRIRHWDQSRCLPELS